MRDPFRPDKVGPTDEELKPLVGRAFNIALCVDQMLLPLDAAETLTAVTMIAALQIARVPPECHAHLIDTLTESLPEGVGHCLRMLHGAELN